jgi:hypothetical protein
MDSIMPTTKRAVTVYLDDNLYERVAAAAKADRRSIANFIEAACDAVAPHELGTRVALASRIAPTVVFEEFHRGDQRVRGEVFIWASRGDDMRRFDIPREVLTDRLGDFKIADVLAFCEQYRKEIQSACLQAWSLAPANGEPVVVADRDFG